MYRTYLPSLPRVVAAAAAVAALAAVPAGTASAQVVPNVTFNAGDAATTKPRTVPSAGACFNGVKVNNFAGAVYFEIAANKGLMDATKLLDGGTVAPPLSLVTAKARRYNVLNLRGSTSNSKGDFTAPMFTDVFFPFSQQGDPPSADEKNFTHRIRGYLNVPVAGTYTYALLADDFAQAKIAGREVLIAADTNGALRFAYVNFTSPGLYPFEIIYFQNGTNATLEFSRTPGTDALSQPLPTSVDTARYNLFGPNELYSAVSGQSNCSECSDSQLCASGNYCKDGLCQPCIFNDRCGKSCMACAGKQKLCLVPGNTETVDTGDNARCVECLSNTDCPQSECDTNTNTCKPIPCKDDNDCKNNPNGPRCERDAGVCIPECMTDNDCKMSPNGNTCNVDAGVCMPMCMANADCKDPSKPICERDAGVCTGCTVDNDCAAGQMCVMGQCKNTCGAGEEAVYPAGTTEADKASGKAKRVCRKIVYRGGWGCSTAPGGDAGPVGPLAALLLAGGALLLSRRRRSAGARGFFFPGLAGLAVAGLTTLAPGVAEAQTATSRALNAQIFNPAIGPDNVIQVDGSRTPGKSTFFINGMFQYALNPARLVDSAMGNEVVDSLVPHLMTLHVMPGVGVGKWFAFGADLPIVLFQAFGQTTPTVPKAPAAFGLGDLRLAAKFRILDNSFEGIGLGFVPGVSIPLGLGDDPNLHSAGKGNVGFEPRFVVDYKHRRGFTVALNLGFLAYLDPNRQSAPGLLVTHQFRYGLGAYVPVSQSVGLFGEIMGSAAIKAADDGRTYAPVEGMVGARIFNPGGFVMNLGVGTSFRGDFGAPQVRALLSIGYLPSYVNPDLDGDGVLNEVDRCPRVPGPKENDGCPDKDTDGDGLIDRVDRCPLQPGPKENYGCPDKDTDKDGIIDRLDKCPLEPGPKENDGCPDTDTDKDGIVDRLDKCPLEPGIPELDGCPDRDTDGDGVVDRFDKCPKDPGPKENQGCPWPDTDGDGLTDNIDKCPKEPGPKENQGCPDKDTDGDGIVDRLDKCPLEPGVPPTGCPEKKFIVVTAEKIELKQKIFFATDKSVILPASFDLLNEVVSVLKERPTMKLRIEGHTDSRGTREHNMKLSEARAASVRDYLIRAGVAPERLTSIGYGPDRPIGDNKTAAGQDKNRRTEFFIVEQ